MVNQFTEPTIIDYYLNNHGKITDKWSLYISVYDEIFYPYRSRSVRFLEIGIQNGGSLAIWAQYFKSATTIVGCDINLACGDLEYDDSRIHVVVGDANSDETEGLIDVQSPVFDLIIDDGSHRSGDIVQSFARYFPKLADDGLFVVEDLHCSYWIEFDGGLFDPWSAMAFFKRLTDILNYEHWGVPYARADVLRSFETRYNINLSDSILAQIHSIEFLNSICVIRKRPSESNLLGARVVVGEDAIAEKLVARNGSLSSPLDQSGNAWSALPRPPEDGLLLREEKRRLEAEAAILRDKFAALQRTSREQVRNIEDLHKSVAAKSGQLQIAQEFSRSLTARVAAANARAERAERAGAILETRIGELDSEVAALKFELASSRTLLDATWRSTSWRLSGPVRWVGLQLKRMKRTARLVSVFSARAGGFPKVIRSGLRVLRHHGLGGLRARLRALENETDFPVQHDPNPTVDIPAADPFEIVAREIFAEQQSELSPESAARAIAAFAHQPLISVIMPVYKTPTQWLRRAVESLQGQYYDHWELCAVDDCSPSDDQRTLLQEFAATDPRVRLLVMERNSGISAASNAALGMAQGEYIALLDHDDELTPDGLFRMVEAINHQPDADFVYSDECKVDDTPERNLFHFVFKPDWSPEIMFNGMITGHLTVYRKVLVDELGGFRSEYDFSQDYDLALRMAEVARRIVHVERVLYLWRSIPGSAANGDKDYARDSNIGALNAALQRREIPGQAVALSSANYVCIAVPAKTTKVSIIIPSDSFQNLRLALQSIRECTSYANYEVVVVCNGPLAERLADEFIDWERLQFVKYDRKYNFSDKCNEGARSARGDVVVFYNDDVFPMQRDWIERLIEYLWVPGVGGVSPKLLYGDNTIQYAGMISGTPGLCGTAYNHVPCHGPDPFLTMHQYVRNVSILSGACCALRKDVFWTVGAFDAVNTPDGHSDMDLSYKLIEAGYRCVYTPHVLLQHIGNHSWGAKRHKYKADLYVLRRWGAYVSHDPYFTESMKRVLYRDFRFTYRIHAEHIDQRQIISGPDILLVSHELSLTGAPRMLFYAAQLVRKAGGFPVVVAPVDGPLREEMVRAGIVVIIDESIRYKHFLFERFARNFDLAIVNTIALTDVVRQLSAINILRTVWWLHEARSLSVDLREVRGVHWERVHALCVSTYARSFVPEDIHVEVLHNGIPDDVVDDGTDQRMQGVLTFVMSGTIEPRKGHDILVEAIALLPEHVRRRCRFLLTGKLWESHHDYWRAIEARMRHLPEITYHGLLDHQAQLRLIAASDVLVCPSRDEPSSLVVMEAAMLSTPSILSNHVGIHEILEDDSCFLFEPESAPSLAGQLFAAYERRNDLKRMGQTARRIFEQRFTLEVFDKRFLTVVSEQIAASTRPPTDDPQGPK